MGFLLGTFVLTASLVVGRGETFAATAGERGMAAVPRSAAAGVDISGEYWALVIGIDRYQSAPALDTAVKDAQGVAGVLVERYGFRRDRVVTLLDAKATRSAIEDALSALQDKAREDDSVLIYYAGHGQWDRGRKMGWWVPVEGAPGRPGTFITNGTIRDYVSGMKARHVYLVADSCFSGTLFGKRRAMPPINDRFYALLYKDKSRWGLTSGGAEPVGDQGKDGHSLFAYHFIKLLRENEEPYLVPSQIFNRLAPIIANNAENKPLSEPLQYAGDEGGQFVFRLASAGSGPGSVHPAAKPAPAAPETSADAPDTSAYEKMAESASRKKARVKSRAAAIEKAWGIASGLARDKELDLEARLAALDKFLSDFPADNPRLEEARALRREVFSGPAGIEWVSIPGGSFMMGSESGASDEKPVHRVTVKAFQLAKTEVTFGQYGGCVRAGACAPAHVSDGTCYVWDGSAWMQGPALPASFQGDDQPAVCIDWSQAKAFAAWAGGRLPTEAEWEYAARSAGLERKYPWGNEEATCERAVMGGNGCGRNSTWPVCSKAPGNTEQGLCDMAGNVWEWTQDWYHDSYNGAPNDGSAWEAPAGSDRVIRGGSWRNDAARVRAALRNWDAPGNRFDGLGFRPVR